MKTKYLNPVSVAAFLATAFGGPAVFASCDDIQGTYCEETFIAGCVSHTMTIYGSNFCQAICESVKASAWYQQLKTLNSSYSSLSSISSQLDLLKGDVSGAGYSTNDLSDHSMFNVNKSSWDLM